MGQYLIVGAGDAYALTVAGKSDGSRMAVYASAWLRDGGHHTAAVLAFMLLWRAAAIIVRTWFRMLKHVVGK